MTFPPHTRHLTSASSWRGRLSEEARVCAPASPHRRAGRLRPPAFAPQLKRDPLGVNAHALRWSSDQECPPSSARCDRRSCVRCRGGNGLAFPRFSLLNPDHRDVHHLRNGLLSHRAGGGRRSSRLRWRTAWAHRRDSRLGDFLGHWPWPRAGRNTLTRPIGRYSPIRRGARRIAWARWRGVWVDVAEQKR